jgi:hypothetical protein
MPHLISTFGMNGPPLGCFSKRKKYKLPKVKKEYAGIVLTLSKYQNQIYPRLQILKFALPCHLITMLVLLYNLKKKAYLKFAK